MAKVSAPPPATARGALSWDKFEEHAKVAFVENASGSRFFFKTSTKAASSLGLVARISTHRKTATELTHHTSTYRSGSSDSLARVTRLLRFAMQEVLGPMRSQGVTSPRMAPTLLGTEGLLPSLALATPPGGTGDDKKKKKKKKKSKK
jgi:hypothetical protein